ncbi:MAG: hypothetical protein K8S00_04310 [Bacteroidales bacterium]|nr:hypothetical protein [Bacteroidales bacterium]
MSSSPLAIVCIILFLCMLSPATADEMITNDKFTVIIPAVSDQPFHFISDDENIQWTFKSVSVRNNDFSVITNYKNNKATLTDQKNTNVLQGINAEFRYSVTRTSFNKVLVIDKSELPLNYDLFTLNEVYGTEKNSVNYYTTPGTTEKIQWSDKITTKEITASVVYFGDNGLIFKSPIAWDDHGTIIRGYYEVKYNSPGSIELFTVFEKEKIDTLQGTIYFDPNVGFWSSDSSIVSGISNINFASTPHVFNVHGFNQMISGGYDGICYGYDRSGSTWVTNNTLVSGISDIGSYSVPTVYKDGSTIKLIVGGSDGTVDGYIGGGPWSSNSDVVSGISNMVAHSVPCVYNDGGTLKLIMGEKESGAATPTGYTGGGPWSSDSNVVSGITTTYDYFRPTVFNDSGTLKLISATTGSGDNVGYVGGGSWSSDNSHITDMSDGGYGITTLFSESSIWKAITGDVGGDYYGNIWDEAPETSNLKTEHVVNGTRIYTNLSTPYFTWTYTDNEDVAQNSWQIHVGTSSGLSDKWDSGIQSGTDKYDIYAGSALSRATTYYVQVRTNDSHANSTWKKGTFRFNTVPVTSTVKTESATNPIQIYTNTSTPYFTWSYSDGDSDTQESWQVFVGTSSGLSDKWDSGIQTGTDNHDIYAGSTLSRNTTYYVQVRTNDNYENSAWETGTFKINALPVITNVAISPGAPQDTDDLTATNDTATDGNGDSVTLYHRWYKNDVLQSGLNDIITILASNLTDDDVWKVGIIPNDGYENGSQLLSATATIGTGNYAPTLSGITTNVSTKKYGYDILVSTLTAYDQNDDSYTFHVGDSIGASNLCNSTSTPNGTEANCTITVNWTTGSHTIYGRLTDANDTSIEYQEIITVDVTPPSIDSSSVTPASGTTDSTYQLSSSISIANGTITSVKVCIGQLELSCTNYTMTLSGENYIYNFSTGSAGSYASTIYASDDSGNSDSTAGPSFFVATGSAGGGGGGGGTNITINETILGDLALTPGRLDTYFILTGDEGKTSYRFISNRFIESCDSEVGTCSISEDRMDVEVVYDINRSIKVIEDVVTITDGDGYHATADVILRIINIGSSIPMCEIYVGDALGSFLSVFFEVVDGVLIGIKTWFIGSMVVGLGYFGYKGFN